MIGIDALVHSLYRLGVGPARYRLKPDGCARRQRAILGLGGSRRFWAVTGGMPMHCATWCDYATERLADENAVPVIDETGFLKQSGTTEQVLTAPNHPYTRELVAAIPRAAASQGLRHNASAS